MLALAYDAGLRREELCSVRTDDLDPSRRLYVSEPRPPRADVNASCPTPRPRASCCAAYLDERHAERAARGLLFLSLSDRNRAAPITLWSWSKVVHSLP